MIGINIIQLSIDTKYLFSALGVPMALHMR